MPKLNLLTATAVALTLSLATAASIAIAQEPDKQTGQGGMMGMMNGVDPAQMKRMTENCNHMMESMTQSMPSTPEKKS